MVTVLIIFRSSPNTPSSVASTASKAVASKHLVRASVIYKGCVRHAVLSSRIPFNLRILTSHERRYDGPFRFFLTDVLPFKAVMISLVPNDLARASSGVCE